MSPARGSDPGPGRVSTGPFGVSQDQPPVGSFPGGDISGSEILEYTLERKIGEGGMGAVYLAVHPLLQQRVAIKVLFASLAQDPEVRQRFIQEARIQVEIRHPGIVQVLTANTTQGPLALVMEYVDGRSLEQVIAQRGGLPADDALRLFRQVLQAVGHAHAHGIIHRDLKPSNIMVCADGTAKVTDFGIAKVAGGAKLTSTGTVMGSAHYMSPEQILGRPDIDARSDIYSLGATLYELVTGKAPFEEHASRDTNSDFVVKDAHVRRPVRDPRELRPDLRPHVAAAIVQAMAKKPEDRYPDCGAFLAGLAAGPQQSAAARPAATPPNGTPAGPPARKPPARPTPTTRDPAPATPPSAPPAGPAPPGPAGAPVGQPMGARKPPAAPGAATHARPHPRRRRFALVAVAGVAALAGIALLVVLAVGGLALVWDDAPQPEDPSPAGATKADSGGSGHDARVDSPAQTADDKRLQALDDDPDAAAYRPDGGDADAWLDRLDEAYRPGEPDTGSPSERYARWRARHDAANDCLDRAGEQLGATPTGKQAVADRLAALEQTLGVTGEPSNGICARTCTVARHIGLTCGPEPCACAP